MVIYSHSKLETFDQCKLKFKYKYVDKIVPEISRSIEAHLGGTVHKALEWLYKEILKGNSPKIDDIIGFYSTKWEEDYSPDVLIVNKFLTVKDYFSKGVDFLIGYYMKNQPFKDNTIATEQKVEIDLDESGDKKLIGYIDRLVHNTDINEIEIHDYKTANSVPTKEKIENSRQLALYSIAIKKIYGKEKKVTMIWHFLAHNIKISARKTDEELEKLRLEVIELIDKIEATKSFPSNKSRLCDWCEYKNICEGWGKLPPAKMQKEKPTKQVVLDIWG